MSKFTDEQRAAILAAGRQAIADADRVLDTPRPPLAEPPVEDRLQKWRRQAAEQERRFSEERAASQPLTEFEASRLEARLTARIGVGLGEQKDFFMQLLPEIIAALQHRFEQKVAELSAEIGQLRADQTVHRALAKGEPGGEIIELPAMTLRKRA